MDREMCLFTGCTCIDLSFCENSELLLVTDKPLEQFFCVPSCCTLGGHSDSLSPLKAHDVLQKDGDGLPIIETYGCAIIASMWIEDYHKTSFSSLH